MQGYLIHILIPIDAGMSVVGDELRLDEISVLDTFMMDVYVHEIAMVTTFCMPVSFSTFRPRIYQNIYTHRQITHWDLFNTIHKLKNGQKRQVTTKYRRNPGRETQQKQNNIIIASNLVI